MLWVMSSRTLHGETDLCEKELEMSLCNPYEDLLKS